MSESKKSMDLFGQKYVILSVIGSHAGESIEAIFSNKLNEIRENGLTYWLIKSFKARTNQIQNMCAQSNQEQSDVYCLFMEGSSKNAARPTIHDSRVSSISVNSTDWNNVPVGATITGKLDSQATALVLNELVVLKSPTEIDLWNYSEYPSGNLLKMQLGASTICCQKIPSQNMKSRHRKIVAYGRLQYPFALFVK